VTLAASNAEEAAVIEQVRASFAHVSAERLLSGPGLVNLHDALARVRQLPAPGVDAATITDAALAGHDPLAVDALNMFCALLGNVAGNLALTLGAQGGVFIGGGIVPRLGEFFDRSPFRQRFEDKGRFRAYLASVPVFVIHSPYPALTGAAVALARAVD
jgi:glucokinase